MLHHIDLQSRKHIHTLELLEQQLTCIGELDRSKCTALLTIVAPVVIANEATLLTHMNRERIRRSKQTF